MPFTLPGLVDFPKEAAILGKLVLGYGEIEYAICLCLGSALNDTNTALKIMYRSRNEETRIEISDAIMRGKFREVELTELYCEAISGAHWCRKIRNQFRALPL